MLLCGAMLVSFASCEDETKNKGDGSLSTEENDSSFEPEYVDLGLLSGTLWATCNVGATKPEGYGDYFAWGEIKPKKNYDWTNAGDYKWGVYDDSGYSGMEGYNWGMTKYNYTDGKTILDSADDAATANWGGKWRMPTLEELYELTHECTWTWTTLNGVYGCYVTSKTDTTKSIFLPAAGHYDPDIWNVGATGHYWGSSLDSYNPYGADAIEFGPLNNEAVHYTIYYNRNFGLPVRPVYKPR